MMQNEKGEYDRLCNYLHSSISSIRVYDGGTVEVMRKSIAAPQTIPGKREEIRVMTKKCRDHMLFILCTTSIEFRSLITLTYGPEFPLDGKRCKKDLDRWLKSYKRKWDTSYFWFIEFQARGAPHYHILSTIAIDSNEKHKWLADTWLRASRVQDDILYCPLGGQQRVISQKTAVWKAHHHRKSWEPIKEDEGAKRYVAKYALKTKQKDIPKRYRNIGRWWGTSRDVSQKKKMYHDVPIDGDALEHALAALDHPTAEWQIKPKVIFGVT